jgi:DeoR/GlpR family transcriptional regulator of sugar metabolism
MNHSNSVSGYERQRELARLLERTGRLSVARVCEEFNISEATARRDLDALSEQGLLQRVHGGAIALQKAPPELPVLERQTEQSDEKFRIGRAAAELIPDGAAVFLGSGTTVLEVARCLREHSNLTIITNSLSVINTLADLPTLNLIAIGGMFRSSELSFTGHLAEQVLSEIHADMVFIGTRAISLQQGLTNDYLPETMTDRAILRIGERVVLVTDHTKFGRVATAFLAPLEVVHSIVTGSETPEEYVSELEASGITVIRA